jgi:GNAT superfamily N-acetyltransferase
MIPVRDLRLDDYASWRPLWDGYCRFYDADVPEPVTDATWCAVIDPEQPIIGRGVWSDAGSLIGFSLSVLHLSTWQMQPSCYLEDLFVDPGHRGAGAGRALLDDLMALAATHGWGRLYWHTQAGNTAARRLYDKYGAADDFVRYRLTL